jgi:hypothetical protein
MLTNMKLNKLFHVVIISVHLKWRFRCITLGQGRHNFHTESYCVSFHCYKQVLIKVKYRIKTELLAFSFSCRNQHKKVHLFSFMLYLMTQATVQPIQFQTSGWWMNSEFKIICKQSEFNLWYVPEFAWQYWGKP